MNCEIAHNHSNNCIASPTETETISFIVVVGIGIIGCSIAVLALGREFFVGKTSTLVIVAALTWVDFTGVLLTSSFVFHGLVVGNGWIGEYPQCQIQAFSTTTCCITSGSIVTFMAIDRTVSLCKPFFYKSAASPSLARAICVAIVTICFLVASLPFMGIGNYILSQTGSYVCHFDLYSSNPKDRVFIIILGLIALVVVTTMLTSNVLVFYLVWKLKKNVCKIFPLEPNRNTRRKNNKCIAAKKEQQMAQFVASVSLIFLLTWLPLTVRLFCNYFGVLPNKTIDLVAMKIALSGFIANPFAYVLFRSIFKRTLKRSFSQIQTGFGNKIILKSQSNKVFHMKVSRIYRENSTVEPSKFVTDIFDPNFTHMRSNTLETIIS